MWYEDLSPCTYFPTDVKLIAVGWLERGKPFRTGNVDRAVYDKLVEFRKNPWEPMSAGGSHQCDLCQFQGEARGSKNIFIPHDNLLFVCPEMIVHYMNAHGHAPPEIFCSAVLACPPMRSMQYLRAIVSVGGQQLIRSTGI